MAGFKSKRAMVKARLMSMVGAEAENTTYDPFEARCVGKQIKFAWLPKKCYITGKRIWLKNALKRTAMWTGPGDNIFEHRWYDPQEYMIWQLSK